MQKGTDIMKSVEELVAIKERMKDQIAIRTSSGAVRIVVGMGTCGIADGAKDVLNAFVEAVVEAGLSSKVIVSQSDCGGACDKEPIVEVYEKGKDKVTYVHMTADRAKEVVEKHIKGGAPVAAFLDGAAK